MAKMFASALKSAFYDYSPRPSALSGPSCSSGREFVRLKAPTAVVLTTALASLVFPAIGRPI